MQEKKDWLSGHHIRHTTSLARQYHESGFVIPDTVEDILRRLHLSTDEARKVWYETALHDRYAFLGEIIDRTVTVAESHVQKRPPLV